MTSRTSRETKRGLTRDTVEEISKIKEEPDWMLQSRLRAYDHFLKRPMPLWTDGLDKIDFEKIVYYRKPSEREEKSWDDVPEQIKATFEKLGIPEAERKFLAGVGAQYDSEVVYHSVKEELSKLGVVFMGTDQGLKEYPEIFRKYYGTVVPPRGQQVLRPQRRGLVGRLVRLRPEGRRGPAPAAGLLPDQRREHRPVRADPDRRRRGRQGPLHRGLHGPDLRHRLAPRRGRRGRRPAGLQGPLHDDPELVERRLQPRHQAGPRARERATVEWIDANTGSRKTVKFPSIYLRGEGASADIISVAVAGRGQHQDTGAKAIHLAPNTTSADRLEVRLQGRRPGHVPRPSQGLAGRDRGRGQRPLRRPDAR